MTWGWLLPAPSPGFLSYEAGVTVTRQGWAEEEPGAELMAPAPWHTEGGRRMCPGVCPLRPPLRPPRLVAGPHRSQVPPLGSRPPRQAKADSGTQLPQGPSAPGPPTPNKTASLKLFHISPK